MQILPTDNDNRVSPRLLRRLNGTVTLFVGLYIFLNPFPHVTTLQEISFYGAILLSLVLIIFGSLKFSYKNPMSFVLLIYLCCSALSILWSIDKPNSIHDVYAHLLRYVLLYFLLVGFYCTQKKLTILSWVIVISSVMFSTWGMAYFYNVFGKLARRRLLGSLPGSAVNTGAIIFLFAAIISLFFVLKDRSVYRRIFMLVCFLQTFLATFLTASRGALAGLTSASMVLLFLIYRKHLKRFLVMLLLLSVLTGLFVIKTPGLKNRLDSSKISKNERLTIWHVSIEIIKDRPLHGFGFGMEAFGDTLWGQYKTKVPANWVTEESFKHPHNFILDVMVRQGFIGFACFALVLFFAFRMGLSALSSGDRFIRNYGACLTAALVGGLVAGLFGKIVSGESAVILYAILAMMTILHNLDDDKNRQVHDDPPGPDQVVKPGDLVFKRNDHDTQHSLVAEKP